LLAGGVAAVGLPCSGREAAPPPCLAPRGGGAGRGPRFRRGRRAGVAVTRAPGAGAAPQRGGRGRRAAAAAPPPRPRGPPRLPAPLAPSRVTTSPARTSSESDSSASDPPYPALTSRSTRFA